MWSLMCPRCLATIRIIPHHSRLNPRTFPGLSADNPQTFVVLSRESLNRTPFPASDADCVPKCHNSLHQRFLFLCSSGRQTSLAFVWRLHRWPANAPHKWSVTQKMFPFDDVIMTWPVMRPQKWKFSYLMHGGRTSLTEKATHIGINEPSSLLI